MLSFYVDIVHAVSHHLDVAVACRLLFTEPICIYAKVKGNSIFRLGFSMNESLNAYEWD